MRTRGKDAEEGWRNNGEHTMRIVTCDCGEKILIIPDKKAMSKAIQDHSRKHKKGERMTAATFLWAYVLLEVAKP